MLQKSVEAILVSIVPLSIHGQVIWDVLFAPVGVPGTETGVARIGPESVDEGLQPGDRIVVHTLFGVVSQIRRAAD